MSSETNQQIKLNPDRRLQFAEEWLTKLEEDPQLERSVVWTDEAKFHLSGSVNRHNCVYWRTSNRNVEVEYNDKSPSVMVWGGVTYQGAIGPFFFEDGVSGEYYLELIRVRPGIPWTLDRTTRANRMAIPLSRLTSPSPDLFLCG
jgi:hypothetical protein